MGKFEALVKRRDSGGSTKVRPASISETRNSERRVGRPRAKRSDPDFQQVTAYIRKSTYASARKLLIDDGREFSELVEELVQGWVNTRS